METQGDRTLAASALKDLGLSLTKKQVKRGKAFDYRDMKAQEHNTLAFNVFTDPCPFAHLAAGRARQGLAFNAFKDSCLSII